MATPIDMQYLEKFTDGNPAEEKEIFDMFKEQLSNSIKDLEKSFVDKNFIEWGKISHQMKGASANLGAKDLAGACEKAEKDTDSNKFQKEEYLATIKERLNEVLNFINERK